MAKVLQHGETCYPEEGAGLLLGMVDGGMRAVKDLLFLDNARETGSRHNRYLITARDMMKAEDEAAKRGVDILGVFHSHPDHPNRPSEFDRQFAMPWFSYMITSVNSGKAAGSRSWRLAEDRQSFIEEKISVIENAKSSQ